MIESKRELKPILASLQGEKRAFPPCWLMRQAGRYLPEYRDLRLKQPDFIKFCLTPQLCAKATLQPLQRFDLDAAILFSDILILPSALQQKVEFHEHKGPLLEALKEPKDILQLNFERLDSFVNPVCESINLIKQNLSSSVALIGFAGAPWTLASYMLEGKTSRDYKQAKLFAFRYPEAFQELLEILVSAVVLFLKAQIEAGAEIIQLFDSWAGMVPDSHFEAWVIEPTAKIVKAIKKTYPSTPIIGFPKGIGVSYHAYARFTGVDAVSLDSGVDLKWIREALGREFVLQGALDPALLVAGGEMLQQEVHRQIDLLNGGPYIFNLGHGIVPETPIQNISNLITYIKSYGS